MTLKYLQSYAEAMLREAGYTGVVKWAATWAAGVVCCDIGRHVEIYINSLCPASSELIAVRIDHIHYHPLKGTAHRTATVALLTEVLYPTDPNTDISPTFPPIYRRPNIDHYESETVEFWLRDTLDRSAKNRRTVSVLATELARRTAEKDRQ